MAPSSTETARHGTGSQTTAVGKDARQHLKWVTRLSSNGRGVLPRRHPSFKICPAYQAVAPANYPPPPSRVLSNMQTLYSLLHKVYDQKKQKPLPFEAFAFQRGLLLHFRHSTQERLCPILPAASLFRLTKREIQRAKLELCRHGQPVAHTQRSTPPIAATAASAVSLCRQKQICVL